MTSNFAVDPTAGSHSLAAAGHRGRWTEPMKPFARHPKKRHGRCRFHAAASVIRLAVVLGRVLVVTDAGTVAAQNVTVTSASPPEAKLAALDAGVNTLARGTISKYGRLLDRLEPRCVQPRERIGDMVLASRDALAERYGKRMTILEFLGAAATMMDASRLPNQDCAQTFTLLVISLGERRK